MSLFQQRRLLLLQACLALLISTATSTKSTLFESGTVISFDDAAKTPMVLWNTSLLVTGDRITAIFDDTQNITIPSGTERVSAKGKIISPGFVDTHRHGWQTAYKTLGSNTTLAEYFERYGEFTQASTVFTADDVYLGQLTGIYEALNSGVTSILEHAHATFSNETSAAYLNASIESGVRMWWCYAFHTLSNGFSIEDQMANFQELSQDERLDQSLVEMGMAYDAFASATTDEIQSIVDLAQSSNISAFTTHYLGGPWFDANSPTRLRDLGFINTSTPIVFSHASYITPEDVSLLRTYNHFVSTTPESEMHYGHDHQDAAFALDQAALGVDTHFTYSTDIVGQARMWLQSTRLKFFRKTLQGWRIPRNSPMSVNQAFLMATRSGGLALRRPDIGVLREGAKADIVVFDGASPNMLGWVDPVAAIILHSHVGDVQHVMVDGNWRKRDWKLVLGQNQTEVEQRFLESAARIQRKWQETPPPQMEGMYQNGVDYGSTYTMDVVQGNGTGY
ncbi:putative amidohydrolase family protein [Neofusicoccum parvum UCRNP2]|uniref:Putative amidohydrolase family protein n=1 Tax=Botryosphaeria parva (strain UCR-NP2) TaxID=1287680 RepID=R1GV59_BOTPV|nr:putative amidohydrolase family protein [Neofusicoccum parvum UCRNP2]